MMISFEGLREFQRKEKVDKGLIELPLEFYPHCSVSIKTMEGKVKDSSTVLELEGMKKTVQDILEMRERKILLMALHSSRSSSPPKNLLPEEKSLFDSIFDNMEGFRKSLIDDIMQGGLKTPKEEKPKSRLPQRPPEKPPQKNEPINPKSQDVNKPATQVPIKSIQAQPQIKREIVEKQSNLEEGPKNMKKLKSSLLPTTPAGRMKVKFIKELPSFMGTDSKAYGPVKPGDVIDLPEDVAQFLISKKDAKKA